MLLAKFWICGDPTSHHLRVRDISATGLSGVTAVKLAIGNNIVLEMRGLAKMEATVVWHYSDSIGVKFNEPIDPNKARLTVASNYNATTLTGPAGALKRGV